MDIQERDVKWGELGYITYARTYSREKKNGQKENFSETVERELYGITKQLKLKLNDKEKEFYRDMRHDMKGSVAGRFMWQLGTKTVDELGLPSLQNCAFVKIDTPIRPFVWAMDMLMLGSGVGYSIKKEHVYKLPKVIRKKIKIERVDNASADFIVPDTREGWCKLLGKVLKAYFYSGKGFTYSTQLVRSKGEPISGFGGTASGPIILVEGMEYISEVLDRRRGKQIKPIDCLDIMNIIGMIVVAGNVRRSAQIALGDYDDLEYLKAKRWDLGNIPNWRAMSNNSVDVSDINDLPQEFWDTYMEGEPYGLINLELSRKVGRLGETQYPDPDCEGYNPCAEQSLNDFETCVTGDTRIQTKKGVFKIRDLVGKEAEVFNGKEWSSVTPFVAKESDDFTRIHFSDGSYLDVNSDHEFEIYRNKSKKAKKLKTGQLLVGDQLPKFELLSDGGSFVENAYLLGAFCGDGYVDYTGGKPKAYICLAESKKKILDKLNPISVYKPTKRDNCENIIRCRVDIDSELAIELRNRDKGLPDLIMSMDKNSALSFIAGFIDTDGNVSNTGNVDNYRIFGTSEPKMRDLQLLCRRGGINFAQLSVMCKKGQKTNFGTRNHDLYRLTIPSFECEGVPTYLKKAFVFGTRYKINNAHKNSTIDTAPRQRITNIESLENGQPSYCFSEPMRNMGVFGNVLTYQCCLAEIYLPNIKSEKEFRDVARMLYRINKHSLALKCHHPETEEIVNKNMRMGIGITGVMMSSEEQLSWLKGVYEYLREYDREYSKVKGWPTSIKLTTVKPSGTLSLLAGVTAGVHPATAGQYYIRRIRISSDSSLVDVCRFHGYHVEYQKNFDGTDDRSTYVVEFPCSYPDGVVSASDMDILDQLEMVKFMQSNWSDNSVSVTAYYKKKDIPRVKKYLKENFKDNFKTLSFLLYSGHGFKQAPYEPISKEQYEYISKGVRPITSVEINENDLEELGSCGIGGCPIK